MMRVLCEARTGPQLAETDQCSLEMFSTYLWAVNIAMARPGSLFGGGREVTILLDSRDQDVPDLQVGQRIRVTGRLRTGDLTVTMIDSVSSISVIS